MSDHNIISQFQTVMAQAGLNCSAPIVTDENIHRFGLPEDKNKTPCWYALHVLSNDVAYGAFGCWRQGISETWCNRSGNTLSNRDKELMGQKQKQWKDELQKAQDEAKKSALSIWERAQHSFTGHPYLTSKQIKPFGLRLSKGALIVPLYNEFKEFCSLQFISAGGEKRFKKNAPIKGCFFVIGAIGEIIYIVEGFATGATIHEATGCGVVVAFNASNLLSVSQIIRKKYPDKTIVVCGDNDAFNADRNIGVEKATEAAKAINAKLAIPQFKNVETKPTDFNDLMLLEGLSEVRKQLIEVKEVEIAVSDGKEKRQSQASLVIDLMKDVELFHDKQKIAYTTIDIGGHKETWRLDNPDFQNWLSHSYWKTHQNAISKNVLQDVLASLHGKACFDGKCKEVYVRAATINDSIYIDLANDDWEVIKITPEYWEVLRESPVKFICFNNMQPLPVPVRSEKIDALWKYVNIPEKYRKLVLAFILECFRTNTPFPILVLYGTQGNAKSTTQKIIRMFIDPSTCNLRTAPRKSEDLLVAAANNWVVSFNNISYLSDTQQDDLCSVSTGGALSTRKLYTTHQEASIDIQRPVIINGIGDLITAQDLIDRCVILELPEIDQSNCKTEETIMREFSKDYAAIFGALLDILAQTLKELPNTILKDKPRMADFATLGTAMEKVMGWEQGSFMRDYSSNRVESMADALEHSPVAVAITNLIDVCGSYEGGYGELYKRLTNNYKPEMAGWVKSAKGLSNQIRRQKQALKAIGIEVIFDKQRHKDGFHVCIQRTENNIHQVHQVHQSTVDAIFKGEHVDEHAKLIS